MDKDMDKEVTMGDESRHQDADANHTVQEEHNSLLARVRSWFPSREDLSRWPWWKQKLVKHFLPLGLFVALVWGLAWYVSHV